MKMIQQFVCIIVFFSLQIFHPFCLQSLAIDKNTFVKKRPKYVNYCQLFSSTKYEEKIIRTTAILYITADGRTRVDGAADDFFYSTICNNKDYFAKADFSKTKNVNLIRKVSESISGLSYPSIAQVTFDGKISLSFVPTFGHLSWLRAEFQVDKIISIKILKSGYPFPKLDSNAPISEAGNSLKYLNAEFMLSLFGRGFSNYKIDNLITDEVELIINGKRFSRREFLEYSKDKKGTIGIRLNEVTVNKNIWRVQGVVINELKDSPNIETHYDNKFILQEDNSWKLVFSKINFVNK